MGHLSPLVRSRTSILAPADLGTGPKAAARDRDLHARLEPLLGRSAVERAVAINPQLAPDDVAKYMLRSAHQMAIAVRRDWPDAALRELRWSRTRCALHLAEGSMNMVTAIWDDVRRIADEVRLQIHLGGMEARERWHALEPRLNELENTVAHEGERLSKAIADEIAELGTSLRKLRDDVKKP